jgi:hypothetical protein
VTTYVAKFLSSVEAEALSRSEGEAISIMAQQRDCFASFLATAVLLAMTRKHKRQGESPSGALKLDAD